MTTAKYCSECGKRLRKDSQGSKCYQCRLQDERVTCRVCGCYCKSNKSRKLSLCSKHHNLVPTKVESPKSTESVKDRQLSLMEPESLPLYKQMRRLAGQLHGMSYKIEQLESSPTSTEITDKIKHLAQQL